jgi:hypothetical protein
MTERVEWFHPVTNDLCNREHWDSQNGSRDAPHPKPEDHGDDDEHWIRRANNMGVIISPSRICTKRYRPAGRILSHDESISKKPEKRNKMKPKKGPIIGR